MSNIYIQEPPALGKVLLKTTVGDIDVELWTKETPKACRNFIQLCLEGYYNGTIFHRLVPDFIVQGGDPNGDGTGGESIYGQTFKDEFHSRLRFNRRGLVAMANAGKDDNGSQFFFTLNTTPELQNKHTIFGKVSGETVYNMLKLADGEVDHNERPLYPHKITGTDVLVNPFEDIVPRVLVKVKDTKEDEKKKKKTERAAVKNFGLLSFGEEAEEDEDQSVEFRGKPKSTHDLLDDPKLAKETAAELGIADQDDLPKSTEKSASERQHETETTVSSIKEKLKNKKIIRELNKQKEESDSDSSEEEYYLGKDKVDERKKKAEEIRSQIKEFKRDLKKESQSKTLQKDLPMENDDKDKKGNEMFDKYIEEQEKYKKLKEKIPKKGASREEFTLQLLKKFKEKLSSTKEKAVQDAPDAPEAKKSSDPDDVTGDDWLAHELRFENKGSILAKDASTKSDDWFDIYDPRNPINKRKREGKDSGAKKSKPS